MLEMGINHEYSPESVDCCLSEWNTDDFGSNMTDHHLEQQQPNSILHIPNGIRDAALFREKTEFSDVLLSIKASHTHYNPHNTNSITTKFPQNASNTQLFTSQNYSPSSYPVHLDHQTQTQQSPVYNHHHQPNFMPSFPTAASMSVNVQMNMTMGYLNPHAQVDHQHHQWSNQNHTQSNGYSGNSAENFNPGNYHYQQGAGYQHYNLDFCQADINCDPFGHNRTTQWTSILSPTHPQPTHTHQSNISQGNIHNHNHSHNTNIGSSGGLSKSNDQGISATLGSKKFYQTRITRSSNIGSSTPELVSNRVKLNLCRVCGKSYARPSTLKTHLRTHSGEKPYSCEECYKSFSQAANLTAHARTHSGEKPFRCLVCERRFSQSSSVTTHMRTHSGERPYRCKMCKKAFSDSSTLTKHLRIHSGEKPYSCKICQLRFSQSGNLNRHSRVHTNNIHLN